MADSVTGVILASGEGTRMRELTANLCCSKHLLPLGPTTLVGRLVGQMTACCEQVVVVVKAEQVGKFAEILSKEHNEVCVVPKTKAGFQGDFVAALAASRHDNVVLTVGDLVFPDDEIATFIRQAQAQPAKLLLALDRSGLRTLRIPTIVDLRQILAWFPKSLLSEVLELDPENFWAVSGYLLRLLVRNKVRLGVATTLFNVNKPENYHAALNYFNR